MRSHYYLYVLLVVLVSMLFGTVAPLLAAERADAPRKKLRRLPLATQKWTGDFDEMLKRRLIRVAIPYSRTLYYIDKGQERGLSAELVRGFEEFLNKKYKNKLKKRPLTVHIYPVTRDHLFDDVVNGTADIATGNLTITDKREEKVDFVPLGDTNIKEVLVTGADSPEITSVDELSGRTVHVRPATSYHESLVALNERLAKSGKPPVKIVLLPDALESEDIMEMLNAGMFDAAVIDNWKARVWVQLLPKVKVHEDIVLRDDSHIGWAIRKQDDRLQKEIEEYFKSSQRKLASASRYQRLMKRVKGLKNNATSEELKKFEQLIALFEKYGQKYQLDPLLLTAMGYQESRLNQKARSKVGAIGVMQLMPNTGNSMRVGNIRLTEPNIHAGAKYLDLLMQQYFSDAQFSEMDRALFAFASYNAGPGNIAKHRNEAARRGYDPNVWFNSVEIVTAERIGIETTAYVRNIYKYYAAYKLVSERQKDREKARQLIKNMID
jgi:membrane-bound lytic murein transglycosylase MltF